jgi:serine/threonine protein kinase/alpha-beta hydrolase superfamily lysophospholipase
MARVYLARDLRHSRRVAIKLLAPEVARLIGPDRFSTEILVTANLSHPNILPLFDSGSADGLFWYVMPYVEGGSLRDRLGETGTQLPIVEALRIAHAIASALDHAHAQGIVHRDIKPENILLREDATYIADFGIALATASQHSTRPGVPIGTPAYMSPEQIAQGDHIDGRADVYALGCLTYEMLAGRLPFPDGMPLGARFTAVPPRVGAHRATFPEPADDAISRAMAPNPDARFPRATDFVAALEAACAEITGNLATPLPHHVWTPVPWKLEQKISYCHARDGVRIAWATSGSGTPLVKSANWLSHLEFDAPSPIWAHWWRALSERHRLIRYDERASGLSDWEVRDISFDAWVSDLEAVIEAAGLEKFGLFGASKGGAIAIAYAARHPERVTHLIIHGAFVRGRDFRPNSPEDRDRIQLEIEMVRLGWGGRNPAFRQAFTTMFFPEANPDQAAWFNELQRISTSPENAARMMVATRELDARALAAQVKCPTLVFHSRDEARVPFREGELLASLIPHAKFVPLTSRNHLPLEHEPAWAELVREMDAFERTVL